jgi:hypothetical protein
MFTRSSANAACGGLKPPTAGRLRRANLHLLHSTMLESPYLQTELPSTFVAHEGSHQMTAQEIGQFGRHRLRPIIFVLNNSGYLSERLRCKGILTAKDWAGPRRRAGGRRPYAEICLS